MTTPGGFPTPWTDDPKWTDLLGLANSLAGIPGNDLPTRMFVEALREAAATFGYATHAPSEDDRVCRAQLVLRLAGGLANAEPARWAVRWLEHIGQPYLRQWWRHAATDRRIQGEARIPAQVTALAADETTVISGDRAGVVRRHELVDGVLTTPTELASLHGPVWSVAARGGVVVAGGASNELLVSPSAQTVVHWRSAVTATATDGTRVACGFETGQVWLDGTDLRWPDGTGDHPAVLALAFTADGVLRCARADGTLAEHRGGDTLQPLDVEPVPGRVAAWHPTASAVAVGRADGTVLVIRGGANGWHVGPPVANHLAVTALAWSPDGRLASGGHDRRIWLTDGVGGSRATRLSLRSSTPVTALAFAGGLLIAGHRERLVPWQPSPGRGGHALAPPDEVTAVGLDPNRPDRMASATTEGLLRQHDADGRIRHEAAWVRGKVHRLAPAPGGWYVAASTGLHSWRPGERLDRLDNRPSWVVVAGAAGRWVAGCDDEVLVDGLERFAHDTTVVDALVANDGSVVTLDDRGGLRIEGTPLPTALPPGSRLLAADLRGVRFVARAEGRVGQCDADGITWLWPPAGHERAVAGATPLGGDLYALAYDDGDLALVEADTGTWIGGLHLRASAVAAHGTRLAAASGDEVVLTDVVRPSRRAPTPGDPTLRIDRRLSSRGFVEYVVRDPAGSEWVMPTDLQASVGLLFRTAAEPELTRALAERLEGWLGAAVLREVADQLEGRGVRLPVRLRLQVGDPDLRVVPWELAVDPRAFRVVRSVEPGPSAVPADPPAKLTLLALRAAGPDFATFGRIYPAILDRFPPELNLDADEPPPVKSEEQLRALLRPASDIIVLLAHAGPDNVKLADDRIGVAAMADLLAGASPRLVVLAACQSVELAQSLAERGVPAVVALRTKETVYALEQLVEELLVNVMTGAAVDDAFTRALDACVRLPATGVPVLYLHPRAPEPFLLVPPLVPPRG